MARMFGFMKRPENASGTGNVTDARAPKFTGRILPEVPESAPTFSREGHHVRVDVGRARLKRNFVSSHEAKKAFSS